MTHKNTLEILNAPLSTYQEALSEVGDPFLEQNLSSPFASLSLESSHLNSSYLIRDIDYRLLECLHELSQTQNLEEIYHSLKKVLSLISDVSLDIRLPVFRKFNLFLQSCVKKYSGSQNLFQVCLEIVLELKRQREANKQTQAAAAKLEWVELEKAVYHLSLWEDQIELKMTASELDS